ncbi:MAG: gliding motility-associated C-terminal domain-containing protein [Bacteroidales bacterium]|nr:gliding motility-associated C-terminal domain-containing protein [Bacteroidales bacterium]
MGKDFWVSVGTNNRNSMDSSNLSLYVIVAADAVVTLNYLYNNTVQTFFVPEDGVLVKNFTPAERSWIYNKIGDTTVTDKSLHIQSTKKATVFLLNQKKQSCDASMILPTECTGGKYLLLGYQPDNALSPSGYTLVAHTSGTMIYDNGILLTPTPLQAGQTLTRYASIVDQTGHIIESQSDSFKFSLFSAADLVSITNSSFSGDCLFEQAFPWHSYGRRFFIPITHRAIDRARAVTTQNYTTFTKSSGLITSGSLSLNVMQLLELEIDTFSQGCYVTSDAQSAMSSYMVSYGNPSMPAPLVAAHEGDPAMAWIPPLDSATTHAFVKPLVPYLDSPDYQTHLKAHYAIIVTPTATKHLTTMQLSSTAATSTPLLGGSWIDNVASGYSYYTLLLNDTSTSLLGTGCLAYYPYTVPDEQLYYLFYNPFGVTAYGYASGCEESYYYYAGNAYDVSFFANNIHNEDVTNIIFCDSAFDFRAKILGHYTDTVAGHLTWEIDGVLQPQITDSLTWNDTLTLGLHTIKMKVRDYAGVWDSATTNIQIVDKIIVEWDDFMCFDSSYLFGYQSLTDTGTFYDTTFSMMGCDSISILHLHFAPIADTTVYDTVCVAQNYNNYGFSIVAKANSGTYLDSLQLSSQYGCDSTIYLQLLVCDTFMIYIYDTVCAGETYINNGFNFTSDSTQGTDYDTLILKTQYGCDSTIFLQLEIKDSILVRISDSICTGVAYTSNGFNLPPYIWQTIDTVILTLQSIHGCDSVVALSLLVFSPDTVKIEDTICTDIAYNLNGFTIPPLATAKDTVCTLSVFNQRGCDSTVVLYLHVRDSVRIYFDTAICYGNGLNFNGFIYPANTVPNIYFDTLVKNALLGCDTLMYLKLTIYDTVITQIFDTICAGVSYNDSGFSVSAQLLSGDITDTLFIVNQHNCDSVVILYLHVKDTNRIYFDTAICYGNGLNFNGFTYPDNTVPNIYFDTLVKNALLGCDTLMYLKLTIYDTVITHIFDTICAGNAYNLHGFTVPLQISGGTYFDTLIASNSNGCDSAVYLKLEIKDTVSAFYVDTICAGTTYTGHGFPPKMYAKGGIYFDTLWVSTPSFCDSLLYLQLIVFDSINVHIFDTICNGKGYNLNGFNIPAQNYFTQNQQDTLYLQTIHGCDSIIVLNLFICDTFNLQIKDSVCVGETYNKNGFFILPHISGGTYTYTLDTQTITGCDSIINLTLFVPQAMMIHINTPDTLCEGKTITLTATSTSSTHQIVWSTGDTGLTTEVSQAGVYWAKIDNGFCTQYDTIVVIYSDIDVSITQIGDYCKNEQIFLTANTNASNIIWNTGETTAVISPTKQGLYTVAAYSGQCSDSTSIKIECVCNVWIPATFTPNEDGLNDTWYPIMDGCFLQSYQLNIFDRWGNIVFSTTDPTVTWDGKVDNQFVMPNTVYTYHLIITQETGKKQTYQGRVTILK